MMPNLHIVVGKADSARKVEDGLKRAWWTAPRSAKRGDVVLFYFAGEGYRGLFAAGKTVSNSEPGAKGGFVAELSHIALLRKPFFLSEFRESFPDWRRWNNLRGMRSHTVPEEYRNRLAEFLVGRNESAALRKILAVWLDGTSQSIETGHPMFEFAYEGARNLAAHLRTERSRLNRELAIRAREPDLACMACAFDFGEAYGPEARGFIEVHHAVPISMEVRKPRVEDLVLLCSNCHSIAHWKQKAPLSVEELRARLAASATGRAKRDGDLVLAGNRKKSQARTKVSAVTRKR